MKKLESILVIANPESGRANSNEMEETLRVQLSKYFNWVDFAYTERQGHAEELALKASKEGYDSVCALGGDGTIAEVMKGLIKSPNPPKLLVFPGGTGNVLVQSLGYPLNKNKIINSIDFENPRFTDVGLVDGNVFSVLLSLGYISESIHEVSNEDKEKFGFLAYVVNVIKNLSSDKEYNLRVKMGDFVYEGPVDHLLVTVSDKFGPIKISNLEADREDGLMNLFILKDRSIWSKAKLGIEALVGDVKEDESIVYMQGDRLRIENLSDDEVYLDLDGDEGPKLPVDVSICSDKIKIYLPKNKSGN